ncbi:hypothetical protein [Nonomuraea sp. NPDC003201]
MPVPGRAHALRERCAALVTALAREVPGWVPGQIPTGGLHLWVRMGAGHDHAAVEAARARGVVISAGGDYFAAEAPGGYLRLGLAAAADVAELAEGARRLGGPPRSLTG